MQYTANTLRNRSLRLKTIIKTKPGFEYLAHQLMLTKRGCKLILLFTLFTLLQGCATHAQEGTGDVKALAQSDTQLEAAAPPATEQDAEQQAQRLEQLRQAEEAQRLEQLKQAEEERLAQIEQEQRLQQQEQARIEQQARLEAQAQQEAAEQRALEQQQLAIEQQRKIAAQQKIAEQRALEQEKQALAEQEAQLVASQIEEERLAQQQARQSRVDLAVQRLSTANYAFEPKRQVEVGEVFEIKVVMQHAESPNSIQDYYPDAETEVSIGQIQVDEYVEMNLKSQNSSALSIVAITQDRQPISKTISPIWRWSVTANEEGPYSLYLNITPIINLENPDGSLLSSNGQSQTLTEEITVVAKPFDFWQWLTTTTGIISAVIGTIFIGVLVNVISGVVLGRVNKGD